MNKIYRIIWSKVTGDYCVVGELAKSKGIGATTVSGAQVVELFNTAQRNFLVRPIVRGIASIFLMGSVFNIAWAGSIELCTGTAGGYVGALNNSTTWNSGTVGSGHEDQCNASSGAFLSEGNGFDNAAYISLGNVGTIGATGLIRLYAPGGFIVGGAQWLQMGLNATANAASGVAIGNAANAATANSIALGASANATGASTTALGYSSNAAGGFSVAVGNFANASGAGAIAIGDNSATAAVSAASDGIALGGQSSVS
ncbi:ESPR-type extended signal peptide-containing protein, partial [Collimonas sp.]|uniref:ESPR-type extended signal peptide-containing protein n=1 Tax=Collimonas sp. TaxID=1963772 RepID=UPI002C3F2FCB